MMVEGIETMPEGNQSQEPFMALICIICGGKNFCRFQSNSRGVILSV